MFGGFSTFFNVGLFFGQYGRLILYLLLHRTQCFFRRVGLTFLSTVGLRWFVINVFGLLTWKFVFYLGKVYSFVGVFFPLIRTIFLFLGFTSPFTSFFVNIETRLIGFVFHFSGTNFFYILYLLGHIICGFNDFLYYKSCFFFVNFLPRGQTRGGTYGTRCGHARCGGCGYGQYARGR